VGSKDNAEQPGDLRNDGGGKGDWSAARKLARTSRNVRGWWGEGRLQRGRETSSSKSKRRGRPTTRGRFLITKVGMDPDFDYSFA